MKKSKNYFFKVETVVTPRAEGGGGAQEGHMQVSGVLSDI